MSTKFGGFKFQKKHVAFLTFIPLLVVGSLVQVDDPVCKGTGVLNSTPGMENVRLTKVDTEEKYVVRNVCEIYIVYKYHVTLSLVNDGPEATEGWIKMVLREYAKATAMDIQYLAVELPGETTVDVTYAVWFTTGLDVPDMTEVHAEVVTGDIPDDTCNGTGKVSLNTWLLVNNLKDRFKEVARVSKEFRPPVWYPPEVAQDE